MKIAYLVLAHKNPTQLKRLLRALGDDDIYVHIDKKQNINEFYYKQKNIRFIKDRVDIKWGGFSMVQATLNLINNAKGKYDFYILLSGDDYPINSLDKFKLFLENNKDKNFIEYDEFEKKWQHLTDRYEKYKIKDNRNVITKILEKLIYIICGKRKMFNNFIPFKGSQWWCLNSEAIKFLTEYINDNPKVINYFKHTHIPDEMFFQTILVNSILDKSIINDNLRYIILESYHPEILTFNHYNTLITFEEKFFARKFDISIDSKILDMLDNHNNK